MLETAAWQNLGIVYFEVDEMSSVSGVGTCIQCVCVFVLALIICHYILELAAGLSITKLDLLELIDYWFF